MGASKITSALIPLTGYSGTFEVYTLMLLADFTMCHDTGECA